MKNRVVLLGMVACALSACTSVPASPDVSVVKTEVPQKNPQIIKTDTKIETVEVEKTAPVQTLNSDKPVMVAEVADIAPKVPTQKYEELVYGAEKELMCTTPIPAKGELKNRPNMQVMWENYLYDRPEGIWGEIGGKVEVNGTLPLDQGRWTNACAVRLSHMLNKAGHKIPRESGNKTVSGGNKDQYYYRLNDFEAYMTRTYGAPEIKITDGTGNSFDLPITPGIVLMDFPDNSFTGHVTIWNGAGTVDGAEIGGYRLLFWDLPCFIPEDRISVFTQDTNPAVQPASP